MIDQIDRDCCVQIYVQVSIFYVSLSLVILKMLFSGVPNKQFFAITTKIECFCPKTIPPKKQPKY